MNCLYCLAPTLESTRRVSDDLHAAGIKGFFLHVVSRDESGLKQLQLHSSNYLETLDLIREGLIGAAFGAGGGLIGAGLLRYFEPFGSDIPQIAYITIIAICTLFGTWVGGLAGISRENFKLRKFHTELASGKYLLVLYARNRQVPEVKAMIRNRHPEVKLAAIDRHFINPFRTLESDTQPT